MLHPSVTEEIAAAVFEGRMPLLRACKRPVIKSVARYKGYISVNLRYFPFCISVASCKSFNHSDVRSESLYGSTGPTIAVGHNCTGQSRPHPPMSAGRTLNHLRISIFGPLAEC